MLLSVISGTYNRLDMVQNLVRSCTNSLPPNFVLGEDWEIVLCDGGSTDGTIEWAKSIPGVNLVEHGELKGAIAAFNDAGKAAQGDYLLVANDDVEVIGKSLSIGLAYMMDNPDVGCGCFYQDRGGQSWHVEYMAVIVKDSIHKPAPYMQVGLIPRWLWLACDGWGEWGGKTYGGDNYLSARVYQSGYRVVPIEGCRITDKMADDGLRKKNLAENESTLVWSQFPNGVIVPSGPTLSNPLPERKRILVATIYEAGHDVQKEQKKGLREALKSRGIVWEVDYQAGNESIVEAAETWRPYLSVLQLHGAADMSIFDMRRVRRASDYIFSWAGDVWAGMQTSPEYVDVIKLSDFHGVVNASLIPLFKKEGVNAVYWQNSFEPVPLKKPIPEWYDIVFLASNYAVQDEDGGSKREKLGRFLKSLPYKVGIFGSGWPDGMASGCTMYDFTTGRAIIQFSRIVIGDNQFPEADGFCSNRVFESLAAGGAALLHQKVSRIEELLGLVPGVDFFEWESLDDLGDLIKKVLENDNLRSMVAGTGHRKCISQHSFLNRVDQVFEWIDNLPKTSRTLSVCMIIGDDLGSLSTTFFSQLSFANEVVIVFTGTDKNKKAIIELAKHAIGSKWLESNRFEIIDHPWQGSFSEARAFAKSKCVCDYIMWVDSDEIIDSESQGRLSRFGSWDFRKHGMSFPQAIKLKVSESGGPSFMQMRIFQNLPGMNWQVNDNTKIHEHDFLEAKAKSLDFSFSALRNIEIVNNPPNNGTRQKRDIDLLMTMPPSPWRDSYLGLTHASGGRYPEAILWLEQALTGQLDQDHGDYLLFQLGLAYYKFGFRDKAKECLIKSDFLDSKFLLGKIEEESGSFHFWHYQDFLDGPAPTDFPSHYSVWRPAAERKIAAFHENALISAMDSFSESPNIDSLIRKVYSMTKKVVGNGAAG